MLTKSVKEFSAIYFYFSNFFYFGLYLRSQFEIYVNLRMLITCNPLYFLFKFVLAYMKRLILCVSVVITFNVIIRTIFKFIEYIVDKFWKRCDKGSKPCNQTQENTGCYKRHFCMVQYFQLNLRTKHNRRCRLHGSY